MLGRGNRCAGKVCGRCQENRRRKLYWRWIWCLHITAGMTDKEKAEKAAWYIGYTTEYQSGQNNWMLLLFQGKGDCLASRMALEYMCKHMEIKARACGNFDYHGQTLIKAERKYYVITTGYNEPKPRSYSITEVSGADLEKIMADNHLKM